VVEAP